jgi:hypothetical protein
MARGAQRLVESIGTAWQLPKPDELAREVLFLGGGDVGGRSSMELKPVNDQGDEEMAWSFGKDTSREEWH